MTHDKVDLLDHFVNSLPEEIEHKLQIGRERYGDSWIEAEPEYMLRRMEEEFYEFRQAVEHDRNEPEALKEMADIVNDGLMYLVLSRYQR